MTRITSITLALIATLTAGCSQQLDTAGVSYERLDAGNHTLEITAPPMDDQGRQRDVEIAYFDGETETVVFTDLGEGVIPSAEAAELLSKIDPELQAQLATIRALNDAERVPFTLHTQLLLNLLAAFPAAASDAAAAEVQFDFDADCLASGSFYECLSQVRL
jgi:hypothetical protein